MTRSFFRPVSRSPLHLQNTQVRRGLWATCCFWGIVCAIGAIPLGEIRAEEPGPSANPPPQEQSDGSGPASKKPAEEDEIVIRATPTQGSELKMEKVPAHVQVVTGEDLERARTLSVTDYMNEHLSGVSVNDAQNNPLQPDVEYRGFTASPLLGLPQGLAVYQDGVRINEPFGDAVLWDLVPQSAVHGVNLIGGASPLFGLNSLGGALSVDMKNGFNFQGQEVDVKTGSFGRNVTTLQSGNNNGLLGYYVDAQYFEEKGWRDFSRSNALAFYGDLSLRSDATDLDLSLQYGDTDLTGNGPAPESLLAQDWRSVFTVPDITRDHLYGVDLRAQHSLSDQSSLSGNLFLRHLRMLSINGDTADFSPCPTPNSNALCDQNGQPVALANVNGANLASFDAVNNQSRRTEVSEGGTLQFDRKGTLWNRENSFVAGLAYVRGTTSPFASTRELATFDATRSLDPSQSGPILIVNTTRVSTEGQSYSSYLADTFSLSESWNLTVGARYNLTDIVG
jgi:iron complex outermembrane receptor protein